MLALLDGCVFFFFSFFLFTLGRIIGKVNRSPVGCRTYRDSVLGKTAAMCIALSLGNGGVRTKMEWTMMIILEVSEMGLSLSSKH